MKRMSRYSRTSRLLVLLLCALLLVGMLPSYGALGASKKSKKNNNGEGRLTFTLANMDKLPEGINVEYTLYKIGVPAPDTAAGWKFDIDTRLDTYCRKIIKFDTKTQSKEELEEIVDALAEEIANGDYKFDYKETKVLSKGSAIFTGLADGIYLGVVTNPPPGLNANASLLTIPYRNDGQADLLRVRDDVTIKYTYTGDLTISKAVVSPYAADRDATYKFTVTLMKDGKVLDISQTFEAIWKNTRKNAKKNARKNTTNGTVVFKNGVAEGIEVKGDESVTITGLPYGVDYIVTEADTQGLTPSSTGEAGTIEVGSTAAFTNTRDTGMRYVHDAVTVNKVDEAGQDLNGATFVLYADKELNEEVPGGVYTVTDGSFQISTDDAALASYLPTTDEESTTLYLVETIAPTGYKLDSTPRKVVITTSVNENGEIVNGVYVTVTTYTITIDDAESIDVVNHPNTDVRRVDDNVTVRKTDGSALLSGATFELYYGKTFVTDFTGGKFEISTANPKLKNFLPAAGETKTLTLKETGVPTGYKGSTTEYAIVITATETTDWNDNHTKLVTTTTYTITIDGKKSADVVNNPVTGENRKDDKVTVTKTDGSELIEGATFTLYDGRKAVTTFTGGQFEISTANPKLKKVLPAIGKTKTLTLKETGAPTGYTGSGAEYTVEITAEKATAWNKDHTKLVVTTIYSISIIIDGEEEETLSVPNEPITGSDKDYRHVTVHKVDGSDQPLKGAEFTLYSGKTAIATYGGPTLDSFSISTSDKALAKYLPKAGESVTLTLKETKAPAGYKGTDHEYTVVLTASLVTDWNEDHTMLVTTTIYDISIDDKTSVTVVNEPETPPTPTPTSSATPTPAPSETPTPAPSETPTPTPSATPTPTPTPSPTPDDGGGGGGGGGVPEPPAPTPTPVTEISGAKIWDDENNVHGVRPGSIEVTLYANGSPVDAKPSWTKSGNQWTYTFSNLPKVDANGNEIAYTVKESPVNYYESTVSGLTITNKLIPREPERYTDLSGDKIWNDKNNSSGKRPISITVRLYRDGVEIDSRVVTAGTDWHYSFQHLPVDDGFGNIYTYEVIEDGVSGYFSRIDGTTVTNSLIDGSVPPPPTSDDETPPPDGDVPTVPKKPEDIPDRNTGTPVPQFEDMGDEELEELFDMFGYGTPLYGMFGTGDQIPVWVWICGAAGIFALVMAIVMGRKKKKTR